MQVWDTLNMTTINTQELKYEPQLSLNEFTEDSQVHLKELVCPLCKGIYVDPILDSRGTIRSLWIPCMA